MKFVVLAILMLLLGILVTTFKPAEPMLTPIVRMRSPEGYFVTYVHDRVQGSKACQEEIRTYVEPLQQVCPACAIESSGTSPFTAITKAVSWSICLPESFAPNAGIFITPLSRSVCQVWLLPRFSVTPSRIHCRI